MQDKNSIENEEIWEFSQGKLEEKFKEDSWLILKHLEKEGVKEGGGEGGEQEREMEIFGNRIYIWKLQGGGGGGAKIIIIIKKDERSGQRS